MKTSIITLALGLAMSPLAIAAEQMNMPMDGMDQSQHQMQNMQTDSTSKPQPRMQNMQAGMKPMSGMQHSSPSIPVSDGSAATDIPVPYPQAMHMEDDPTLTKVMIDQLEVRNADQGKNPLAWDAQAWIGQDLNKLWLKTEGSRVGSKTEDAEVQALYSHAIAPFWDVQTGVRKDIKPASRTWAAVGVKGLSPYEFDVDAALFAGDQGRTAARLKGEYEIMLTQKTILSPEAEINLYGKDDPEAGIGSGLSDASAGLRLRHEFKREFAPYIGVNWSKKFGGTAEQARQSGEKTSDTQFVAGVRLWF